MIVAQSKPVGRPQAHHKNAEGVLSFLRIAQPGAPKCNVGGSQSTSPFQLKTKNPTLTISKKIGKVKQTKARVFAPPGGVPGPRAQRPAPFNSQPSLPSLIRAYSTLFVGFFCKKIRNFFTGHFLKISGKSRKNEPKKHAKTPQF